MVSERLAPGRWTWGSPNDATLDHSSSDPVATRPHRYTSSICVYVYTIYIYSCSRNIIIYIYSFGTLIYTARAPYRIQTSYIDFKNYKLFYFSSHYDFFFFFFNCPCLYLAHRQNVRTFAV